MGWWVGGVGEWVGGWGSKQADSSRAQALSGPQGGNTEGKEQRDRKRKRGGKGKADQARQWRGLRDSVAGKTPPQHALLLCAELGAKRDRPPEERGPMRGGGIKPQHRVPLHP